jgi:2-polyprenyl-3-methyl-5-hydroxy-6-metoxy-1,4-benzoquinol methylase
MSASAACAQADVTPPVGGLHDCAVTPIKAEAGPIPGVQCIACAAEDAHPRFAIEGVTSPLVVCGGCGLGWLEPIPSPAEVASFYPEAYYGGDSVKFQPLIERLVRIVGVRHIRFLCTDLSPGARVLDIGCGRGVLLAELAARGLETHGVEHTATAARGADPRAHIRIAPELTEARYPAEYFDKVIIWHVLEHLRHPRATIDEVQRILRPGGRLIVAVPNFGSVQAHWAGAAWFHLDPPRHLYHFPLSVLRALLNNSGFVVESEHHMSLRQNPFGWIQSGLNRLGVLPRNGLYTLLHERAPGKPVPFDARTRFYLWLGMVAGAPFAVATSVVAAVLRTGATVHVVARRVD